jgi:hypothetical protein
VPGSGFCIRHLGGGEMQIEFLNESGVHRCAVYNPVGAASFLKLLAELRLHERW